MAVRKKSAPKRGGAAKRAPAPRKPKRPLLTGLSTDWYWEQDAQFRLTRIEVQTGAPGEQERARRNLGKRHWETGTEAEGGWDAYRALLEARTSFRDFVMWRDFEDGSRRYISLSGEPTFDAKGRFTGYRGVGRYITEQKRGELLLRLQHTVTRRLGEAPNISEGIEGALRAICEAESWDLGELWRLDEAAGALRRYAHWSVPGVAAAQKFAEASDGFEFKPGQGLVGIVWRSGESLWIPDAMQDPRAVRKSLAEETGLRGALLCPVAMGERVVGVLNFVCRRIRPPDEALLQALMALASQLGGYLQRADIEVRLRESEERFRRTFELAGVGFAHVALDGRLLRVNRRLCEMLGYSEQELVGRSVKEISFAEDRDVTDAQRERLRAGECNSVSFEKRYLHKNGSVIWVDLTVAREHDPEGNPLYEISVLVDITARKAIEAAMRESEGRFRSLTELSSDFFWEQDCEYRFTRLEGQKVEAGDPGLSARLIGTRRWDGDLAIEGGWDAHRAQLEAHQPFFDALMWRTMPDGSVRYVSVSGEPVIDAEGRFSGYRGVGRDVTEKKGAEQLLQLEHNVARTLSAAKDALTGLISVIRLVCETENWGCGCYFEVDRAADELVYRHGWNVPGTEFKEFLDGSRGLRFKRGQGLVGLAWQGGEPIWSTDTSKDPRVMAKALTGERARGTFVFGVIAEGETFGLLSFTSQDVRKPDEGLLQTSRVIGSQIGQFLRRTKAEESLRQSEVRFRNLTEMSSDFFWETDVQHRFVDLVHGPGYTGNVARNVGTAPWELPSTHPDAAGWAAIRATMDTHGPLRDVEFGRPGDDGTARHFSVSGEPHFAADGSFVGYRGVGRDITEIALARERIASLAYHDPLTGLANRTSLAPALEQAVERSKRRGSKLAGLFLDLDGFKQINDLHGHDAGDRLLVELANRLRGSLRASDPLARLGGDEFFVVLEGDLSDTGPIERVAKKLLAAILAPYDLGGGKHASISASIGISIFPDDAGDAPTLMKHADMAMYAAKQAGKNSYRLFTAGPAANDARRAEQDSKTRL